MKLGAALSGNHLHRSIKNFCMAQLSHTDYMRWHRIPCDSNPRQLLRLVQKTFSYMSRAPKIPHKHTLASSTSAMSARPWDVPGWFSDLAAAPMQGAVGCTLAAVFWRLDTLPYLFNNPICTNFAFLDNLGCHWSWFVSPSCVENNMRPESGSRSIRNAMRHDGHCA